jgi:hypothetical protein
MDSALRGVRRGRASHERRIREAAKDAPGIDTFEGLEAAHST